jgi:hypothetical protein
VDVRVAGHACCAAVRTRAPSTTASQDRALSSCRGSGKPGKRSETRPSTT